MLSNVFTKENLDAYLKELAKEFRRLNGKSMPAEINGDFENVYTAIKKDEIESKDILINFEKGYPKVANESNINDILKLLKEKRKNNES